MSDTLIRKSFENFRGNDRGASDITRAEGFVVGAKNVLLNKDLSATKRKGSKLHSRLTHGISPPGGGNRFRGLFAYSYLNTETGGTENEVVVFDGDEWIGALPVRRGYFNIRTTSAVTTPTFEFKLNTAGFWEAICKEAGVVQAISPSNCGTGLESAYVSLSTLASAITALTGWSVSTTSIAPLFGVTFSPAAMLPITESLTVRQGADVNGAQSGVNAITVDSGHDIQVGDLVNIRDRKFLVPAKWVEKTVSAIAATSITIEGDPVDVNDNDVIYNSFLRVDYIEHTMASRWDANALTLGAYDVGFKAPNYVNLNDVLYFSANEDFAFKYDGIAEARIGLKRPLLNENIGVNWYADVTSDTHENSTIPTKPTSSGSLTGTYKHAWSYSYKDNRGNEIESPLSDITPPLTIASKDINVLLMNIQVTSMGLKIDGDQVGVTTLDVLFESPEIMVGDEIQLRDNITNAWISRSVTALNLSANTVTISGAAINVLDGDPIYITNPDDDKFPNWTGLVNGNQTGVNTILTDLQNLRAGQPAYFFDRKTEQYVERLVISYSGGSSITIEGDPVDVNDHDVISVGLKINIYRTLNSGNDLYLVESIPHNGFYPQTVYVDDTSDGELERFGLKYIPPPREYDPPPKCSIVNSHQGLLILAGARDNPNTIFFSEPQNIEGFPAATNAIDIPFTTEGPITGIVSESGMLVVFKKLGRAYIRGDLANNSFIVEVVEDGIGSYCHNAIQKIPTGVIFPSRLGFQLLVNGELDSNFAARTAEIFNGQEYKQKPKNIIETTNESKLVFERAIAVNDFTKGLYLCYVPSESGKVGTSRHPTGGESWFCYDYRRNAWFDYLPGESKMNAYCGIVVSGEDLYYGGLYKDDAGVLSSVLWKEHRTGTLYDYADNTKAIDFDLPTSWDHANEPSVFKKFLRLKTWMLSAQNFIGAFTLRIRSYFEFQSTTSHSDFEETFSASTVIEQTHKLKAGQNARSMKLRFSNNVLHECPVITGYEYETKNVYRPEIKK